MAAPSTPSNFYLQTGNGENFLSWDLTATATSYKVQRSTDGVTFALLASPSTNYYLDSSVTVQTRYYYKVAATNGDGDSAYTAAQNIVPTLSGELCLGEIRQRAQERADRVNSKFVTLPEWNFYINQAYYELYDLLITCYEDYFIAPRLAFSTDGSQSYDLPNGQNYSGAPALYKLYGVDLGLNSGQEAWVTLKKFDFIQRNRYVYPQLSSTYLGVFNLRYRMVGNKIMFIPSPSAGGQNIGLWYFPRLTTMLQDADVMDGFSGWTQYVIIRAAKYALDKEESDTSKLDAELMFLKDRIEESAQNRDAGQGDTISNTRTNAERWGGFGGGYGDGSWAGF